MIYANFESILLTAGTWTFLTGREGTIGAGTSYVTATTVHQLFCLTAGTITITPVKGDVFVWPATAGQSINVLTKRAVVSSGSAFVAFRAKLQQNQFFGNGSGT